MNSTNSPSPIHEEEYEPETEEHLMTVLSIYATAGDDGHMTEKSYRDAVGYIKSWVAYRSQYVRSLLADEERKVRERVRDWVEIMWKYDNNGWTDKDEIVASIQSYLEGKHKQ